MLIGAHVAIALVVLHQVRSAGADFHFSSDIARYRLVATTPGTPYRDFEAAYPPLALYLFKALGPGSFAVFAQRVVLWNLVCHAAIAGLLFRRWGMRAGWSYLALSAPLTAVVFTRFDLAPALLAVVGAALVSKRPRLAAIALVTGAFVKVWPVVLVPGYAARRQWRAFVTAIAAGAAGLLAWVAWAGTSGFSQVLTARGARGWQFESVPGSVLRLLTRDSVHFEARNGAWRLGAPPGIASATLTVVFVVGLVWLWVRAARSSAPEGVAETAAIVLVIVTGTLFSPQYVVWFLPFVAIAAANGARPLEQWAAAVSVSTLFAWMSFDVNHVGSLRTELLVGARNVALVGLLVVAINELRSVRARRPAVAATA